MDYKTQGIDSELIENKCSSDDDEESELVRSIKRMRNIGTGRNSRRMEENSNKIVSEANIKRKTGDTQCQSYSQNKTKKKTGEEVHVFFYKKIFYKKMSLKNRKILRKF